MQKINESLVRAGRKTVRLAEFVWVYQRCIRKFPASLDLNEVAKRSVQNLSDIQNERLQNKEDGKMGGGRRE